VKVLGHGCGKFPTGELIDSSAKRGWVGLLAERRSHPAGELPTFTPQHGESAGRGLIFNPGVQALASQCPFATARNEHDRASQESAKPSLYRDSLGE